MSYEIRRAKAEDCMGIMELLKQVNNVHAEGRPDLFIADKTKYTPEEVLKIISDDTRPIFTAVSEEGSVLGYGFCVFQPHHGENNYADITTLYIDDLCVDSAHRGQHIGRAIYNYILDFAEKSGCYNVTLNVWSCNPAAMKFYESVGLVPFKVGMEKIL